MFIIMTMNRVDGLPPELLRKGRVDELFFVDLPNDSEREEILGIHLRRVNGALTNLSAAVAATQMFSGAEIAAVVDEAALTCFQSGTKVNAEAVAKAARETRPLAQTMPEQIASMREFAALRARRSTPLEIPSPSPEIEIDLGTRFGSHGFPSFSSGSTKN